MSRGARQGACRLAAVLAALGLAASLCGHAEAAQKKLLVAIVDRVAWSDLLDERADIPTLRGLARQGSVGMMCVRTARGAAGEGGYLTIGAGTRTASRWSGTADAGLEGWAFQKDELLDGRRAGDVYLSYTGWLPGDNAIVHLGIGELMRLNAPTTYPIHLGLLGGTLQRAGVRVACVGNADTPRAVHREVVAVGMNEQGLVEVGYVGAAVTRDGPSTPSGSTVNVPRLLAEVAKATESADLVVVDLAETSRAAEYVGAMPVKAGAEATLAALERADQVLGAILRRLARERWGVLVVTPNVRTPGPDERYIELAPVIFSAPPAVSGGVLTSPSTRQPGVVVNTDLAATILTYFGVSVPPDTVGRPITSVRPPADSLDFVRSYLSRADAVDAVRRQVFRWLPIAGAVALWLSVLLLLLRERAPGWARRLVRGALLVVMSAPAALLLAGWRPLSQIELTVGILALAAALAVTGSLLTMGRSGHALPALAVVGLLVYDLVRGQGMLRWSPLSYSAAAGARFYGVGNEYGGVLLGAGLIAVASVLSSRHRAPWGERPIAALVLLGIAAVAGFPRFGANLGVAFGCAVGFGVFILYLWRTRPGWTDVVLVLGVAVGVAAAAALADMLFRGTDASHIGRWVSAVRAEGWVAVAQVAARKLSMNWLLMRVSVWADLAFAALAVLAVAVLVRPPGVEQAVKERSWLAPAVGACAAGAAAAAVLNDSGVVAAALALLYGAGSLAYVSLEHEGSQPAP